MRVAFAAAIAVVGLTGCLDTLEPGQFGKFRYVGQVEGGPPLKLLPPTLDREGNVFILRGSTDISDVPQILIGSAAGYWGSVPNFIPTGHFGVHGWLGHTFQNAYVWIGDQVWNIDGFARFGAPYLEKDPNTDTAILYRAVIPWIRETPSRTSMLAYIQSSSDKVPFLVVINLEIGAYFNVHRFSPSTATEVTFLGTGFDKNNQEGVVLLHYNAGGAVHLEARFYDADASLVATTRLSGGEDLKEYAIQGFLQANDAGLFAGLDDRGNLVVFNKQSGRFRSIGGMTPVGVHTFDGHLYLVGTNGGPVIAPINDDGTVGKAQPWTASRAAASALKQPIVVIDDRRLPSHSTTWKAVNAMGPYPFVSAHNPAVYASDETGWLVAGPSYDYMAGPQTAIAFAPVGISYP